MTKVIYDLDQIIEEHHIFRSQNTPTLVRATIADFIYSKKEDFMYVHLVGAQNYKTFHGSYDELLASDLEYYRINRPIIAKLSPGVLDLVSVKTDLERL